jgi:ATP-dependent DNA ligase
MARLHPRSCIIDGEAVACDDNGVSVFHSHPATATTTALYV